MAGSRRGHVAPKGAGEPAAHLNIDPGEGPSMSVRKRAAFAGAVLALAVAPAAHANSSSSVASSSKAAVKKAAAKQKKAGKGHKGDSAANASRKLRRAVSAQGMTKHLQNFQRIADDNGGNRASGFQGYGGSVEYVVTQLRN